MLYQNPETIVFVPISLLTDLLAKEFEAVKEMKDLQPIEIDFESQQAKSPEDGMFSPMKINNRDEKENGQQKEGTSGIVNFIGKSKKT